MTVPTSETIQPTEQHEKSKQRNSMINNTSEHKVDESNPSLTNNLLPNSPHDVNELTNQKNTKKRSASPFNMACQDEKLDESPIKRHQHLKTTEVPSVQTPERNDDMEISTGDNEENSLKSPVATSARDSSPLEQPSAFPSYHSRNWITFQKKQADSSSKNNSTLQTRSNILLPSELIKIQNHLNTFEKLLKDEQQLFYRLKALQTATEPSYRVYDELLGEMRSFYDLKTKQLSPFLEQTPTTPPIPSGLPQTENTIPTTSSSPVTSNVPLLSQNSSIMSGGQPLMSNITIVTSPPVSLTVSQQPAEFVIANRYISPSPTIQLTIPKNFFYTGGRNGINANISLVVTATLCYHFTDKEVVRTNDGGQDILQGVKKIPVNLTALSRSSNNDKQQQQIGEISLAIPFNKLRIVEVTSKHKHQPFSFLFSVEENLMGVRRTVSMVKSDSFQVLSRPTSVNPPSPMESITTAVSTTPVRANHNNKTLHSSLNSLGKSPSLMNDSNHNNNSSSDLSTNKNQNMTSSPTTTTSSSVVRKGLVASADGVVLKPRYSFISKEQQQQSATMNNPMDSAEKQSNSNEISPTSASSTESTNNNNNSNNAELPSTVFDATNMILHDITDLLTLPQKEAASRLGISESMLCKRFKESTRRKWPYRFLKKLEKVISMLHLQERDGTLDRGDRDKLDRLLQEREECLRPVKIRITSGDRSMNILRNSTDGQTPSKLMSSIVVNSNNASPIANNNNSVAAIGGNSSTNNNNNTATLSSNHNEVNNTSPTTVINSPMVDSESHHTNSPGVATTVPLPTQSRIQITNSSSNLSIASTSDTSSDDDDRDCDEDDAFLLETLEMLKGGKHQQSKIV